MRNNTTFFKRFAAVIGAFAMLAPSFALRASDGVYTKSLSEEQKIIHVLNRLGFGARPGDVERVKAMGLSKYIDQQLNPSSIDDSAVEAKVKNLEVMNLSTSELFAKYPNPGALLRQLEGGKVAQANAQAQANAGDVSEKDRQERQQ